MSDTPLCRPGSTAGGRSRATRRPAPLARPPDDDYHLMTSTTRWAAEPHIRLGDPCHDCGCTLAPASRCWSSWTLPPGVRKHDGHGLCSSCAGRRRRAGTMHLDLTPNTR